MPLLLWPAGAAAAVAVAAGIADRRRQRRADLDAVGVIDWRTVQVAALVATLILVSVAVHTG